MNNRYSPPTAEVADRWVDVQNNSGGGRAIEVPPQVKGWSWGAFLLNWIWALANRTWIGLLCLVPYVGIIVGFYLGFKGRELAWRNKRWDSFDHFQRVQQRWSFWGVTLVVGMFGLGVAAAIAIPAYQHYVHAYRTTGV